MWRRKALSNPSLIGLSKVKEQTHLFRNGSCQAISISSTTALFFLDQSFQRLVCVDWLIDIHCTVGRLFMAYVNC